MSSKVTKLKTRQKPAAALDTPTDLDHEAVEAVSEALNRLLADSYALYLKTKNFHWHVSGPHFRDYHLLLDEQAADILGTTDDMAERVRKIGGTTLRSIGHIAQLQSAVEDNDADFVPPEMMLKELMEDNKKVAEAMRKAHEVCDEHDDIATPDITGVELAGVAKNAAALAAAAAAPAGPNAAGAAAGKVFAEVEAHARRAGARPETFSGLAGTGDLVATVIAHGSRNRRAGELLAAGVAPDQIVETLGQTVEGLDTLPLLADRLAAEHTGRTAVEGLAGVVTGEVAADAWLDAVSSPSRRARAAA